MKFSELINLILLTSLKQQLGSLTTFYFCEGGTNTDAALKFVRQNSFTAAHGSRPGAAKILVVLTDGQSNNKAQTISESQLLHQAGIEVMSIGIVHSADSSLYTP